ncbi:hypothetical protein HDE_03535 [Halotydeus destructor]|nr:hypothetical protein HDE_03535 [Halotydeus destructor]
MASKESAIKVRGYYNKFWKLVCDPTKEEDVDHATLYARWQHFYQHDFLGFNYLASPVNIYEPDEIHLVNVADFLRENNIMNQPFIGESENRGEKVFLSGAFDESQSYIGAPFVVYNNYMVQVEVPDVIKIKCVIYDFEGLEEYLNDHSEDKAKAIFREMSQLTKVGDSQIPQRLYFSRVEVNGSGKDFSLETSQSQEDEQKKILVKCSEELSNYTQGCIQLNLFYFVSHVGIDHIKVGVANVPFNCRSFVTHHQSLCRNVLERNYGNVERKLHCVDYKFPDRKKAKKMAVRDKYPVRGCLWREGGNPIVGIVEGRKAVQYVAQASLFTSLADTSTTVAFMARHDYSQANAAGIAPQPAPEGSASYNSNDKVTVFVNTPASERMLELTHFVRQISSPIFDVAKGYPVHSFYNLNPQSGSIADPIFNQLVQKFDSFINADGHGSLPAQAGNMDTSRARTSQGGSRDPPTGSPQQDSDLYPLIAILSASAALYLFL